MLHEPAASAKGIEAPRASGVVTPTPLTRAAREIPYGAERRGGRALMKVNQKAIADLLGLDRTTVTKILNRDPKYSASEATREKVFRAAEILGYDFTSIRRPFKREHGRTEVDTPVEVTVTLEDGTVFDTGTATVGNLSVGGVLLTDIRLTRQVLPLRNFTILTKFREIPELAGLVGECEVVRFAGSSLSGEPELGVRFVNATHRDWKKTGRWSTSIHSPRGEPVSILFLSLSVNSPSKSVFL